MTGDIHPRREPETCGSAKPVNSRATPSGRTPDMLRPHRFDREVDPGPVQIQARKVHFDVSGTPLHWIPDHPVASNVISLLNIVLPAAERWFVATYDEALPLVKDPRLAEDMRGFIGQEATH